MTFAAALDAVPPHVRDVALRLVEAAGGREPAICPPDEETETGWILAWSTPVVYVDIEFDASPPGAVWFFSFCGAAGAQDGGDLPADSIPEPLARALRSLA